MPTTKNPNRENENTKKMGSSSRPSPGSDRTKDNKGHQNKQHSQSSKSHK